MTIQSAVLDINGNFLYADSELLGVYELSSGNGIVLEELNSVIRIDNDISINSINVANDISLNGNIKIRGNLTLETYVYWRVSSNLSSYNIINFNPIPYNIKDVDTHNSYSVINYTYTIPMRGIYILNASSNVAVTGGNIQLFLNDNPIAVSPSAVQSSDVCIVNIIYNLNIDDILSVKYSGTDFNASLNDKATYFTGYRLPS